MTIPIGWVLLMTFSTAFRIIYARVRTRPGTLVRCLLDLTMASSNCSRVCRLCRKLVESKRAVSLFTTTGIQQQWASRIQTLLSIPVSTTDGLPGYICDKCKLRVVSLEKAAVDLREFKQLASCSMSALERVQCPVKRSKCTSSDTGVSPDTAKERPRSKLSRKKLDFDSKIQKVWNMKTKFNNEYLHRPFEDWCYRIPNPQ